MQSAIPLLMFMSVLFPAKLWFTPNQPIMVQVRGAGEVTLTLTDFGGKAVDPSGGTGSNEISGDQSVDLKKMYLQEMSAPGTYVVWAVPKGKSLPAFVGTPLVVEVRDDRRRDAPPGPMVIRIEPLRYAKMSTDLGEMTMAFYFDAAPNTAASFLSLAQAGFYDGLTFHRVVPGFVVQAGDPRGDGTGGPGFNVPAEFNDREHHEGVLSMAREGDPLEREGAMPRGEFANSAGSQFFICLNYEKTKQLDRRYTAFGKVVEGIETVRALGKVPVGGATGDVPTQPPVIKSVQVLAVTPDTNPYAGMMNFAIPTTAPGKN